MIKKAFITGITGQDGSYLAEFLLKKKYKVFGIKRRSSLINTRRIDHIFQEIWLKKKNLTIFYGDLNDTSSLSRYILKIKPDEIYNLAAQSHVKASFDIPVYTSDTNALGALRILELIKNNSSLHKTKFYQASTSEMFGGEKKISLTENNYFKPKSPYAVSKLFSYWTTINYREGFNIFACNGILFNHESPRRGETFVTKKIIDGIKKVLKKKNKYLYLGNLNAERDWGHAKDYIPMMWKMLQQKKAQDFVISTGKSLSIRRFCELVCKQYGFNIGWKGKGLNEFGYVKKIQNKNLSIKINQKIIKVHKEYLRPNEVNFLKGNYKKAQKTLGWNPKISIKELIQDMIENSEE
tara:strand:- start:2421 stop:3476 length:1056 start_codon:yes stop_codon:yes gene_type:complete